MKLVRNKPSPNSFIFGWLPETSFTNFQVGGKADSTWGEGEGQGKAAFGIDFYIHPETDQRATMNDRAFAHEIGHLLNLRHTNTVANLQEPKYCLIKTDGKNDVEKAYVDEKSQWPWTNAKIHATGLDLAYALKKANDGIREIPSDVYDFMSYCGSKRPIIDTDNAWIAPWTYRQIYNDLQNNVLQAQTQPVSTDVQRYFLTNGLVFTDNTVTLDPTWVFTATSEIADIPSTSGQYCLQAEGANGVALLTHCFDLTFFDYESGEEMDVDGFTFMLPYPSATARIVLSKDGNELAEQMVSDHAPEVTLLTPNGGEFWGAGTPQRIQWQGKDADGDPLEYLIEYAPDGQSWVPLAITTTTAITVDTSYLPGGEHAKVRIAATDGVNTSEDESDTSFTVDKKEPLAIIFLPERDGKIVPPGESLYFQGAGYDLEDGQLNGDRLNWVSNKDGYLGTGKLILAPLSTGNHVIRLTATDSDGNTSTATVNVFVGYQLYLPSVQRQ